MLHLPYHVLISSVSHALLNNFLFCLLLLLHLVQVLLTCGRRLDYKAVNDQGETAGDIARRNGNCLSYFETLLQHEVNETSDL